MSDPVDFGLLEAAYDVRLDCITALAAQLTGAPQAMLSVIDEPRDRQVFKAHTGLPEPAARETPLRYSFCKHVRDGDAPLVIMDATEHALVRDNPAVTEGGVRAYLGVPFHDAAGVALGALCCVDTAPRAWSADDLEALRKLSMLVDELIQVRVAYREREAAYAIAAAAARSRASFFAHASHETRTPLTKILGAARLLRTRPLEETAAQLVAMLEGAALRLRELMDDILALSEIEGEGFALRAERFDLVELAEEAMAAHAECAAAAGVTLRLSDRLADDRCFLLDREMLLSVLRVLMENALRSTPQGRVDVILEPAAEGIRVIVRDTGRGLDATAQARLFEPFGGWDPTLARPEEMPALGMAVLKRRVQALGGTIAVTSAPGEGSTFTLDLPLSAA